LWHLWRDPAAAPPLPPAEPAGGDWPVYSILVPLYRETALVEDLVRALDRLDWPLEKREILFVTEADDAATRRALVRAIGGRAGMHVVVVPAGEPRTKPRALMYALGLARGDLVVVYDAEDEPAPDQLRLAHAQLSQPNGRVGCVQAQLNIYNARRGFMTRQFALEYTALFDAILPSLRRLGLPVPLGGTSNHFRGIA
jgi:cellulose synthase/poly-beta-1,6-N-acetylglucosamine synthase-like glycosyltransferase